jgi:sugar/nucleoside kinase (ribokinase family)
MSHKKVIGCGFVCLDQVMALKDCNAPIIGNKVVGYEIQGGGPTGTALVAVSRLGGQAEFWGAAGDDDTGDMVVGRLAKEGVDVSQLVRVQGQGPVYLVFVDQPTGHRYIHGGKSIPAPDGLLGDPARLAAAGCLLVDGAHFPSALRAAQEARRLGVPVVGDVMGVGGNMPQLLANMDYAVACEYVMRPLGADNDPELACRKLRELGAANAVITLGDQGCAYFDGTVFARLPAFSVPVVDTTGAGDTFHGAFCFAVTRGLSFKGSLIFASATAALKCRKLGGRAGIPTLAEVTAFLDERAADLPGTDRAALSDL